MSESIKVVCRFRGGQQVSKLIIKRLDLIE